MPQSSPTTDSSQDVRSRLLEAAGPIFARCGFDRATVREICAAADVNVASVGYYFGDKMGLYREVIEQIRDSRERQFPAPSIDAANPQLMLYRLIDTMLSRMLAADSSGWESQLLMREMQQPTEVFERIVKEFFRPLFGTLVATLERIVGGDVPRQFVDQLALSVVGQCVYYRFGSGVIELLISPTDRKRHYDIPSLGKHIWSVSMAAAEGARLITLREQLDGLLENRSTQPVGDQQNDRTNQR